MALVSFVQLIGGLKAIASQVMTNFNRIGTEINGNLGYEHMRDGGITVEKVEDALNPGVYTGPTGLLPSAGFVITGLDYSSASGLVATFNPGQAIIRKTSSNPDRDVYISKSTSFTATLEASRDNYVDLREDGNVIVTSSTIGSSAPTLSTDTTRLWKLTTDATTVTSNSDLRSMALQRAWPKGYMTGRVLLPGTDPNRHITIKAGLKCRDTDDSFNIDITSDITDVDLDGGTGAGKLDTGSPANSTMYALWVIADSTGANPNSAVWSTNYTTGPTMPSGYDKKRLIGVRLNDSSGNIAIAKTAGDVNILDDVINALDEGNSTSASTVDVATPAGLGGWFNSNYANGVIVVVHNDAASDTDTFYFKNGGGQTVSTSIFTNKFSGDIGPNGRFLDEFQLMTGGASNNLIQYIKVNGTGTSRIDIDVKGWIDNLGRLP